MDRALSSWESGVVAALTSVDSPSNGPDVHTLRESLPYLVVTSMCGCGCPSFSMRDSRIDDKNHVAGSFHYSNAVSQDGGIGMFLLVANDRPESVDVRLPPGVQTLDPSELPEPSRLIVTSPYQS